MFFCPLRKSSGGAALVGLHWTCVVVHNAFNAGDERKGKLWEKLVSIAEFSLSTGSTPLKKISPNPILQIFSVF